ncbi:unnamed protein product [Dibothriocephalus latus]|uniref:Uncharacterized protein n=1 Tax=Dibothriocephalus latus TaxID=60516 RepID=A0A3P6TER7_DIBLA|nr:unnamed protein product [Dibothriocephalus latus]
MSQAETSTDVPTAVTNVRIIEADLRSCYFPLFFLSRAAESYRYTQPGQPEAGAECLSGNQEGSTKQRPSRGPSVERWVHLHIAQGDKASLKHIKTHSANSNGKGISGGTTENLNFESEYACDFAVCLTQAQLVVISTVTVIVVITVGLVSLIALRQKHIFPPVDGGCNRREPMQYQVDGGLRDPGGAPGEEGGFQNMKSYEYVNCSSRLQDCTPPSTYSNLVVSHEPWMQTPLFHQTAVNETTLPRCSLVPSQRTDFILIPSSIFSQTKPDANTTDVVELNPNLYNSDIFPRTVTSSTTNASIITQALPNPGENNYQQNASGIIISNPCLATDTMTENRSHRQTQQPTKQSITFLPRGAIQIHTTKDADPLQALSHSLPKEGNISPRTLENPFLNDNEILLEAGTEKIDIAGPYLQLRPISGGGISKKSTRQQQVFLHAGIDPAVGFMPQSDNKGQKQPLASISGTVRSTLGTEGGKHGGPIQVVAYDMQREEMKKELAQSLSFNEILKSDVLKPQMTPAFQVTTSHTRPTITQGVLCECNSRWCAERDRAVNIPTSTTTDRGLTVDIHNYSIHPRTKEVRCSNQQTDVQSNDPNSTLLPKRTATNMLSTDAGEAANLA